MIMVFIAPGFEEIEGIAVIDILRRAELDVLSVGIGGKNITGAHGITVQCDISDNEIELNDVDMIVLPGGMPGTLNLEASAAVQTAIDFAVKNDRLVGAICAAPSILGHKNVLDGKNYTCFPGFETQAPNGNYTGNRVEQDGKIITGKGPGAAIEFSLKLVECLLGKERANILGQSLQ